MWVCTEDVHSANIPGKACLLEKQVEKFSRFILVAYDIEQEEVVLPQKDGREPWTVPKISIRADIC